MIFFAAGPYLPAGLSLMNLKTMRAVSLRVSGFSEFSLVFISLADILVPNIVALLFGMFLMLSCASSAAGAAGRAGGPALI
ncbi:MAG: hypothetical protein M1530_00100 [Candidatus Marsarchaeota archaeon]|nr:hypothetical protein [Candidatus Marsarchaeota archaeon]